jgi:ankyrin repeat protein
MKFKQRGGTNVAENALMLSSKTGNLKNVKSLVSKGVNVNVTDKNGRTALMFSSVNDHLEVVKYLVENGADVNAMDNDGDGALIFSSVKGHLEVVKYLVENGADVNTMDNFGKTALMFSSERDHLKVVKYLVENGADVNAMDNSTGKSALMFSSERGHLKVVKYLVENGTNLELTDMDGNTALIWSSKNGHLEVFKYLVSQGANVNATDEEGKNTLIWSSLNGHLKFVKFLVENGEDVNVNDNYGKTPLMASSEMGHLEVVKFLVENDADVNLNNKDGKTALELAKTQEIKNFLDVGFLLEDINSKCDASKGNLLTIAKILKIDRKDINKENVCQKIEELFSKKSQEKIKNLDEENKNKCTNDDTLFGTDLKDVHPMFFYTIKENNKLFCGDIREFIKLEEKKNPYTRTKFTETQINKMKEEYNNLKTFIKNIDDKEEVIQETIEITLRRAMNNVLNELSYVVDVEQYVNADDEKINRFINSLKIILSVNDIESLNKINQLPNKKLALANILKLKLDNDTNVIISGGNKISELRSGLQEIYNNTFELN